MKVLMAGNLGPVRSRDDGLTEELRRAFPDVTFELAGTNEDQLDQVRDVEVYSGWPTREVFLAAKQLRWLHIPGTGIDQQVFGIPEFAESDVVVTNCRGPHADPMADHVIGMMVTLAHRLRDQWDDQRAGNWDISKYDNTFVPLTGKTMGILALGDIGAAIARRAHGFGMRVYAVDKFPDAVLERNDGVVPQEVDALWGLERLDEMMGMSDWFVIAAPLTPSSRGMIDKRRIGLLKDGAYFILISRGGIADEDALAEALRAGRLAGAAIDSFVQEPLPKESPFWEMENVIVSPHSSAVTTEMWEGRSQIFKENMRRYLAKEPFLNVCDTREGF